jgi:hypothetical protein
MGFCSEFYLSRIRPLDVVISPAGRAPTDANKKCRSPPSGRNYYAQRAIAANSSQLDASSGTDFEFVGSSGFAPGFRPKSGDFAVECCCLIRHGRKAQANAPQEPDFPVQIDTIFRP